MQKQNLKYLHRSIRSCCKAVLNSCDTVACRKVSPFSWLIGRLPIWGGELLKHDPQSSSQDTCLLESIFKHTPLEQQLYLVSSCIWPSSSGSNAAAAGRQRMPDIHQVFSHLLDRHARTSNISHKASCESVHLFTAWAAIPLGSTLGQLWGPNELVPPANLSWAKLWHWLFPVHYFCTLGVAGWPQIKLCDFIYTAYIYI